MQYQNVNSDSQKKYAFEAYHLALQLQFPGSICDASNQIGSVFYNNGQYDSSLIYYKKSLGICRNNSNLEQRKEFSYNNIGNVFLRLADYEAALSYYDTGATLAKAHDNNLVYARIISNIGTIYYEKGAYTKAVEYFIMGLKIHEELRNENDIALSVLNLSNVYYRLKDYTRAKEYIARAMQRAKQTNDKWSVISCHTTYASIYNEEKKFDSSLICLQEALALSIEINRPYITNLLKGNIAECYLHLNQLKAAQVLYAESLEVSKEIKDIEGIAIAKSGLGQILVKQGQYGRGIKYLKDALDILQKAGMKQQVVELAGILAETHEKTGDYKSSLKYVRVKDDYQDSMSMDEALNTARKLEFEYELEKKEAQISLLEKDKAIEEGKAYTQRILLLAVFVGMLLAIIIALLFFRNLRNARKSNELILQQKEEIEQQAEKLQELNTFKDTTFSVLSHDLRSPINALTGTMAMLDEGIITPEEFAEHKNELDNKLQSVTLMLDNLLQWAKSQMQGEHTLDIEKLNVRRKALKSFAVLKDAATQKNINLTADVPENLFVYADKNQVEMVLRNLVSNAVKFTPKNGDVSIAAKKEGDMIHISVTDTGIGMTQELADKLFDGNTNNTNLGTDGEKGTGIGLQLSHTFVKNNNGDITVQSKPGMGTTFTISLPASSPL